MSDQLKDQELGMTRRISRRDFLDGAAIAIGGAAFALHASWALGHDLERGAPDPTKNLSYDPPALEGMRGNHPGSFTVAHALRDGAFWVSAGEPEDTGEVYDLIVVGAGISGLSAAYFYRQIAGTKARILILDNHDDFGGHAKRNEFQAGHRLLLSNGGTQSIENPGEYSRVARKLLAELGVDLGQFYKAYDQELYSHLGTACFFNREQFGEDRLIPGMNSTPWPEFLAQAPISLTAKRDIARLYTEKVDYLRGLSREEKRARLAAMSYAHFLTKVCGASEEVLPFFQSFPHDLYAVGIDAISALACYNNPDDYHSFAYAGFDGLDLGAVDKEEPYIFHFPDGNASIARLLVRSLVPGSISGNTMDDIVLARTDYSRLDVAGSSIRIRLNSTAARVRHLEGVESGDAVEVAYVSEGKLQSAKGKTCVLACYNMMIPYLCLELPEEQKQALHYCVKEPLIYTHVALRNWTAFQKLGIHQIVAPAAYHTHTALDFPVSLDGYRFPSKPEEPMVLFMLRTPCQPGLPRQDQYRAGRYELMATPFSTFERNIRDQLNRMLGSAGFDAAREITGITVNRWAHGYAYEYDSLSDPHWPHGERPCIVARKQFGRISIANSDAAARAYTDAAVDMAYRAVQEQTKTA